MKSPASDGHEPAGELAGRLAALAHLFAIPVSDVTLLKAAGLQVAGLAEKDLDADELAAEHYRVLSHDLVPDAGVFLEDGGMLGGPLSRQLHERMAESGFTPDDSTRSTGHIVNELGFLAHLLRNGRLQEAAAFWKEHASGWMPLVVLHLERSDAPWFEALGAAFAEALHALQDLLASDSEQVPNSETLPLDLPEAGLDLDEPRVGLARIGAYLAIPARSGLVLSRSTLSRIGRSFRLPTGFGSRSRIVEGLLRSGGQYDGWEAVCDALLAECDAAEACWTSNESPHQWAQMWLERLTVTRAILTRMRRAEDDLHAAED